MEPVFNFMTMFQQSIGLDGRWQVVRAEYEERDKAVHVYVEAKKTALYACPKCGKESPRYDDEDQERLWRHADILMLPCYVHCRRPRVKCQEHGIHVVDAPWARKGARQTLLFESYAMLLVKSMPINEARKVLRLSWTALRGIVSYWVEEAVERTDLSDVSALTIDETSFKRGQSYVTVVGDPARRRVIGVEDGRDKAAVERFSWDFSRRGGDFDKIQNVSMDMSRTYQSACEECFPKAKLVFDRFHVKKLVLEGLDDVRKQEQGKDFCKSKKAGKKLLMIPERKATENQLFAQKALCEEYPRTGRAFRIVQQFDDFYACGSFEEAAGKLKALTSWMMHSRLEPMKDVARSLREKAGEILEYFNCRLTNAFAEGMNSLIQAAKRRARGFRTYQGYRTMIFLVVGKLKLSCPSPFLT